MVNVVSTEQYQGLTLDDLLFQILFELGQVSGVTYTFDRFPRKYLVQKINDRQNKFVFHSQCLRKVAIVTLKAGVRNYKLPANCMDGGILSYPKFFDAVDSYQNLEIKDIQWLDDHYEGWLVEDSGQPLYVYMGESYGNTPMLGVYPPPDTDGDSYLLTPDTGITVGSALPGTANDVVGRATGGSSTTLQDAAVDFTVLGLGPGMTVLNVSDSSKAVVVAVATHQLDLSGLAGGTANAFGAGDSYNVLAGEYGVVTSWEESGDKVLFASEVGTIASITVPKGNIRVDYIPYPLPFADSGEGLAQYPEIPRLYHMDFAMGVVADLLRTFSEATMEFSRSAAYEQMFGAAVALARSKKDSRPYMDKPVSVRPVPKRAWRRNA